MPMTRKAAILRRTGCRLSACECPDELKKYSALLSQPSSLQSISLEDGPALAAM